VVGSASIAALIAHAGFWALLLIGFVSGELDRRHGVGFGVLWALGRFGLRYLPYGESLLTTYLAILDIVLVFMIFKGDVRLR
jgi:hypothetical protein